MSMVKLPEVPIVIFALALLICTAIALYQVIVRDEPLICGTIWLPASDECEPLPPSIRGFVSEPFQMNVNSIHAVPHNFNYAPISVDVWSSSSKDGPWDKIDSVYSSSAEGFYGVWITDVDDSDIRAQSGNMSATSTYGLYDHWKKYFDGKSYDFQKVWFRVTAVFDLSLQEVK
jgi:hypothetical protein